ncbi:MAG TPA: LuxR C-terminal-related transcriptional regulator [Candidatus Dormibacteraeota bacterium]
MLRTQGAKLDRIAGHLLHSGATGSPETVMTLRAAAGEALALAAPDTAAVYLARALAENPERQLRSALMLELATAEHACGSPAAIEHYEEVRRLSDDPAARARAALAVAELGWFATGDNARYLALSDLALADIGAGDQGAQLRAEAARAGYMLYDPRASASFRQRVPELERLRREGGAGARPLALVLAAYKAQTDAGTEAVVASSEQGWDSGAYLSDGEPPMFLPQVLGALLAVDELDRASAVIDELWTRARRSGSVIEYLLASAHQTLLHVLRGELASASEEAHAGYARAVEVNNQLAALTMLFYIGDVLIERPDAGDLAQLADTFELGPLADLQFGAFLKATRARLRFAAGRRSEAVADMRSAGAAQRACAFTNPIGCPAWRSQLALMLGRSEHSEALQLVNEELRDAERSGMPRRIGVAVRALGLLTEDWETSRRHLEQAVTILGGSPARLEHARALVELGAALRRHNQRAGARLVLRDGLDLADRCGAVRLADRAYSELAATGARPRRQRVTGREALTASELRVAHMAAEGQSSKDIAQALFVTTRTVDSHLNRIYSKLGISSRARLQEALAG